MVRSKKVMMRAKKKQQKAARARLRRSRMRATMRVGLCMLVMGCLSEGVVLAELSGADVVKGKVRITQDGKSTVIDASHNSIINFERYAIEHGATVEYVQPNASSRVLNRVVGVDPTVIAGELRANGQVYIVNPHGIHVMNGAVIDVAGIHAAAGNLSDANFLGGIDHFQNVSGSVLNEGSIQADVVSLVGAEVVNQGTIFSPDGFITMVAGEDVYLSERDGHVMARVETGGADAAGGELRNSGSVDAGEGGRVSMAAGDMYALAVHGSVRGGDVRVAGGEGSDVDVRGSVDASRAEGVGGRIEVVGDKVAVHEGANLDASGEAGGGEVLVGGGFQGQGTAINSSRTYLGADAEIAADALSTGEGGTIVLWSDGVTVSSGRLSARGAGGDAGGLVETSGKEQLLITQAPRIGTGGTWLLDPTDIHVVADGDADPITLDDVDAFADNPGTSALSVDLLENATSDVVLQATNDILFQESFTFADDLALIAQAGNDIVVENGVTLTLGTPPATGSALHFEADSLHSGEPQGTGIVDIQGTVTSGGAASDITLIGSAVSISGTLSTDGQVVLAPAEDGVSAVVDAGGFIDAASLGQITADALHIGAAETAGDDGDFANSSAVAFENVTVSESLTLGDVDQLELAAANDLDVEADITTPRLFLTAATATDDGAITFDPGVAIRADDVFMDATASDGGHIVVNNATFADEAGTGVPSIFYFEQHAAIDDSVLPELSAFDQADATALAGTRYQVRSANDITLTVGDGSGVENALLIVRAVTGTDLAAELVGDASADTGSIRLIGTSATADDAVLDFSEGNVVPENGLFYSTGNGTDTLSLVNVNNAGFDAHDYQFTGTDAAELTLSIGGNDSIIDINGATQITNDGSPEQIAFTLPDGVANPDVLIDNDAEAGFNAITGSTFIDTRFARPEDGGSIAVSLGDVGDEITVAGFDTTTTTALDVEITGGDAADDYRIELGGLTGATIAIDDAATDGGGAAVSTLEVDAGGAADDVLLSGSTIESDDETINYDDSQFAALAIDTTGSGQGIDIVGSTQIGDAITLVSDAMIGSGDSSFTLQTNDLVLEAATGIGGSEAVGIDVTTLNVNNAAGDVDLEATGDVVLSGTNTAGEDLSLTATGAISEADGATSLSVTGHANFGGTSITLGDPGSFDSGTLTFVASDAAAISSGTIALTGDSSAGTGLALEADSLSLDAGGSLTVDGGTAALDAATGDAIFEGAIDGEAAFSIDSAGTVRLSGGVGRQTPLSTLTVTAAGGIEFDTAGSDASSPTVHTLGPQTYEDAVTLTENTYLISDAAGVSFDAAVTDGDEAGADLTIVAESGVVAFADAVDLSGEDRLDDGPGYAGGSLLVSAAAIEAEAITLSGGAGEGAGEAGGDAGNLLLSALAGTAVLDGDITAVGGAGAGAGAQGEGGNLSIAAAGGVQQGGDWLSTGTIDVASSGGSITMDGSASSTAENADIRYAAAGNVTVGVLDAGSGSVAVDAGGSIVDGHNDTVDHDSDGFADPTGDPRVENIVASTAMLQADGNIGAAGNPLDLDISIVAADAGGSTYLYASETLTIGGVNPVEVQRVGIDGSTQTVTTAGMDGLTSAGLAKVETVDGLLRVTDSITAGGDVLLAAGGVGWDLVIENDVTSDARITLLGASGIEQDANLSAAGTIDAEAFDGAITMNSSATSTTDGQNIRYLADGDVTLGTLDAGGGSVAIVAGGSIVDAQGDTVEQGIDGFAEQTGDPRVENAIGEHVSLRASGGIGAAGNPLDVNVSVLAAEATADTYIYATEAVTIGFVPAVSVDRVSLDSDTQTVDTASLAGLKSGGVGKVETISGDLTVDELVDADRDVLLAAGGSGSRLSLNADVTGDADVTDDGNVTLLSGGDIAQDADVSTSGGTIGAEAGGSILMAEGTISKTDGENIRYEAGEDVQVSILDARTAGDRTGDTLTDHDNWGDLEIFAGDGSIIDAFGDPSPLGGGSPTINIWADALRLEASGDVGGADNGTIIPLDVEVQNVAAAAGGAIYLNDDSEMTITDVSPVAVDRIGLDSSSTPTDTPGDLEGLMATDGGIRLWADEITLAADAKSGEKQMYFAPVLVAEDATVKSEHEGLVFLDTIDAVTGEEASLTLLATGEDAVIAFNGDIGVNEALDSLFINNTGDSRDPAPLYATIVAAAHDAEGDVRMDAADATFSMDIRVDENVIIGAGEKFTSIGSLTIENTSGNAAGKIQLADVTVGASGSTDGSLTVRAADIEVHNRPNQLLIDAAGEEVLDKGGDIVVTTDLTLDGSVSQIGDDGGYSVGQMDSSGTITIESGSLALRTQTPEDQPLIRIDGDAAGRVLDGYADGITTGDPTEAIAAAAPRPQQLDDLAQETSIGQAQRDLLRQIGINARDMSFEELLAATAGRAVYNDIPATYQPGLHEFEVAPARLPLSRVSEVLELYRSLFWRELVDEDGQVMVDEETGEPRMERRTDDMRQSLEESIRRYRQAEDTNAIDPLAVRSYLRESEADEQTWRMVQQLEILLGRMELLGLTPFELNLSTGVLLREIVPQSPAMELEAFETLIRGREADADPPSTARLFIGDGLIRHR